jgi:hypothetical protein
VQPAQEKVGTHEGVDAAHESKEESERTKLFKVKVPIQIFTYMATVADAEADGGDDMNDDEGSRTELDSHANMPVVCRRPPCLHNLGYGENGRRESIQPRLRIDVHTAVQYDCPYSGQSYRTYWSFGTRSMFPQ